MKTQVFSRFCVLGLMLMATLASGAGKLPDASYSKLPRWRGFNLLEKFQKQWSCGPCLEEDFQMISELGFNFVRLPMDYRSWIKGDNWLEFNETVFTEIDQAVYIEATCACFYKD